MFRLQVLLFPVVKEVNALLQFEYAEFYTTHKKKDGKVNTTHNLNPQRETGEPY